MAAAVQSGASEPGMAIRSIATQIVEVPTIRAHKLSSLSVSRQAYVLARVTTEDGVEGIGEAATLGGPGWAEEAVETIKAVIDSYLAPALIGLPVDRFEAARRRMAAVAKRNNAAKSALESALFDAAGKTFGLPASAFLGGAVRHSVEVLWALASGDAGQEIEEAGAMIAARRHKHFKIKIGANDPAEDLARLTRIATALEGRGRIKVVDANQAWDEATADRWMPALAEIGVELIEQPLAQWNIAGSARLAARHALPILADEMVFSPNDAFAVASHAAADAISLKLVKHGGLLAMREVAAIAEAAGIGLYGGCLLESSIGTAAHLQVYATLPRLAWGSECFGPSILRDDLAAVPLTYADFSVQVPTGPGLGVVLDEDKIAHYSRA